MAEASKKATKATAEKPKQTSTARLSPVERAQQALLEAIEKDKARRAKRAETVREELEAAQRQLEKSQARVNTLQAELDSLTVEPSEAVQYAAALEGGEQASTLDVQNDSKE